MCAAVAAAPAVCFVGFGFEKWFHNNSLGSFRSRLKKKKKFSLVVSQRGCD